MSSDLPDQGGKNLENYFKSSESSPFDALSTSPPNVPTPSRPKDTTNEAGTVPNTTAPENVILNPVPPSNLPIEGEAKPHQHISSNQPSKSPFDYLDNVPASNKIPGSAMMNPVYMSPSDEFAFNSSIPSPDNFLTPASEQVAFTANLLSSDADRRHDAWIPSETTKKALQAMVNNPPGIYFPEKELLTMPGIAIKENFGDPIKTLLRSYVGEEAASKRKALTASSVTQDDRGLRQLILAGCYHAAVNLTTQLLTVYGQGEGRAGRPSKHTAHSVQLWFTRFALLVKLRRFSLAEVESEQFGNLDGPDLYFEFYPELYGGRKGSMVPFSFRLLLAELPHHLGKHPMAIDRLNSLLLTCSKIVTNLSAGLTESGEQSDLSTAMREDSLRLWRNRTVRVKYSIASAAAYSKDYRLCDSMLRSLVAEDSSSVSGLYSAMGRLHLQLGDVEGGRKCFQKFREVNDSSPNNSVYNYLHDTYVFMVTNDFTNAVSALKQAHQKFPDNPLVINNLGVSLVYIGHIREAINVVEPAVYSAPDLLLHESLVLNLATMYELESSNATANKIKLLELVSKYRGDSFATAALKLH